jgi:hypothetical protein
VPKNNDPFASVSEKLTHYGDFSYLWDRLCAGLLGAIGVEFGVFQGPIFDPRGEAIGVNIGKFFEVGAIENLFVADCPFGG